MVKTYAELCLENQQLREHNRKLRMSNRISLVIKIGEENLELQEEVESQKKWIAYLEARLEKHAKSLHR